jgi:hypothetical protein
MAAGFDFARSSFAAHPLMAAMNVSPHSWFPQAPSERTRCPE